MIEVEESSPQWVRPADFDILRLDRSLVAERARIEHWIDSPPDKTLALVAEMRMPNSGGHTHYSCPMHPEVVSDRPGACPICGMKLIPTGESDGGQGHTVAHHQSAGEAADGIEWEDTMVEVNRATTPATIRWSLVDRDTGKHSPHIDWVFRVGDRAKIRLVNEMASDHPMHHPFHIHGQRFLVLARDGVTEPNLVWKDTVLVRTGEVVDILMEASNPGLWMAHCHIPEHMGSGMMFTFRVDRQSSGDLRDTSPGFSSSALRGHAL